MRPLAVLFFLLIPQVGFAQLFPNAPWNKSRSFSSCPGGVCPSSSTTTVTRTRTQQTNVVASTGSHWTYPGNIYDHLINGHGQSDYLTSGLTPEQAKTLHDNLHEGRVSNVVTPTVTYYEVAPVANVAPPVSTALPEPFGALGDRRAFRRDLLAAAKEAKRDGEITLAQYALIAGASFSPNAMEKIQATVMVVAEEQGIAQGQIDWIALIKELIPIILQLLEIFT